MEGGRTRCSATGPCALAAALALALAAVPARAQSLLDLYQAARGYDATYLSARALAESRPYAAAQVEALGRPSASLTATAGRTVANPQGPVGTVNTGTSGATLAASQSIYNRPNRISIEQARQSVEAARYELDTAEQDLIVRVAQAYFDVLGAQDTLGTASQNKTAINEQLASAKRNFEVGTATITDTREAQARFDLARAQELIAENDLQTRRIVLDQLVGRTGAQPKPLATPVVLPALPAVAVDEWVTRADAQHPNIRRAQIAYDTAKLETDKARAQSLPTLAATGQVSTSHDGSLNSISFGGNTHSATVGVQLAVPLFTGYQIQNRIKETLVLEEKAREDLEVARRQVATATKQTFFGLVSGNAQVQALEAAESSSQLALEATQLGYRVGVRVNLDVLNAQTQLFTARRDLARARYDVLLNHLRLRQASGQLNPQDVVNLDSLFVR